MSIKRGGSDTSQKLDGAMPLSKQLEVLTLAQIKLIDQLLKAVGDFGEVHLIVTNGELRFVNKVESYKFLRHNLDNRFEETGLNE